MEYRIFFLFLAAFIALSFLASSETTGSINTTTPSAAVPPTSGVYGYTVDFCGSDLECFGYNCFIDFDGTAGGSKAGWCNQTSITDCYHDGINYTKGFYFCTTNTTYRRCDANGLRNWSTAQDCTSGQTCSNGMTGPCTASSSSSSSSGSGSSSGDTTKKASVEITVKIGDFEIVQDNQTNRTITVKNNGDLALGNVYVEFSGAPFATVLTGSTLLNKSKSYNFTVSFAPASATEVKTYEAEAKVVTNYTNATASFKFKVKVLPSARTVTENIIPAYEQYLKLIEEYERNITAKEADGHNLSEARGLLITIKAKMLEINQSIAGKDYFKAATQISEAKVLFDEVNSNLLKATKPPQPESNLLLYLLVAAVVIIGGASAFLFWPKKPQSQ